MVNGKTCDIRTHLEAIVSPTAELHLATLIVEGEPRDIDFARRLEDPRWHIQTRAVISHYYVRWICAIEALVGAVERKRDEVIIKWGLSC